MRKILRVGLGLVAFATLGISTNVSAKTLVPNNPYATKKVQSDNPFPKKGDYQFSEGLAGTYLADLENIPDYSSSGLDFTNTQYTVVAMGPLSSDQKFTDFYNEKALFDKESSDLANGRYVVIAHFETDIANSSPDTLNFFGFSSFSDGKDDWIIPGNKQIDPSDVALRDDTSGEIQAGKTIEDKKMDIILSSGLTIQEAVSKIPEGALTIKTSGIEDSNYQDIGGERAIDLKMPSPKTNIDNKDIPYKKLSKKNKVQAEAKKLGCSIKYENGITKFIPSTASAKEKFDNPNSEFMSTVQQRLIKASSKSKGQPIQLVYNDIKYTAIDGSLQ